MGIGFTAPFRRETSCGLKSSLGSQGDLLRQRFGAAGGIHLWHAGPLSSRPSIRAPENTATCRGRMLSPPTTPGPSNRSWLRVRLSLRFLE